MRDVPVHGCSAALRQVSEGHLCPIEGSHTMFINQNLGELNLKVAYYGPALSGKTTNLEYIYANLGRRQRTLLGIGGDRRGRGFRYLEDK